MSFVLQPELKSNNKPWKFIQSLLLLNSKNNKKPKIAIYSAIYGNYDDLKYIQPKQDMPCDFIMFTDNSQLKQVNQSTWQIKMLNLDKIEHPRMRAKYIKLNPHLVLPDYDYTIWIDGSVVIRTARFINYIFENFSKRKLIVFKHPERNCVYKEAEFCKAWPKYKTQKITEQIAYYRSLGYPREHGLSAATIIFRDNRDKDVHRFDESWWEENQNWSYQDQISLEYLIWKMNFPVEKILLNLWDNPLIIVYALEHKSDQ
ncbi:MAG: glycosyltransferase domain-containing protein [bacterium]